ncbi:Moesin [Trichuris trichiura]|uniref:Moesin n=1 Tax=Trichuris trichiura TaxID=36087 RepID=A0A077YVC4_TRITR|nr:Moesin [Trichuris trichiura]
MSTDKSTITYLYVIVHVTNLRIPVVVHEDMSCQDLIRIVKRRLTYFRRGLFGLQYEDSRRTLHWAAMNQSVMDLFVGRSKVATAYLRPNRFPNINWATCDAATVRLFYHHLRKIVAIGSIDMTLNVAVNLKAIEMQSQYGNCHSAIRTRGQYLAFGSPPAQLTGSDQITDMKWKRLVYVAWAEKAGMTLEQAIEKYMNTVDKLPKYGVLYFQVWNDSGKEKFFGIGVNAIRIYDPEDTALCEMEIPWGDIYQVKESGRRVTIHRRAPREEKLIYYTERRKTATQIAILSEDYREVEHLEYICQRPKRQQPTGKAVKNGKSKTMRDLLLHAFGAGNGEGEKFPNAVRNLERVHVPTFEKHKAKYGKVIYLNGQAFFKSHISIKAIDERCKALSIDNTN